MTFIFHMLKAQQRMLTDGHFGFVRVHLLRLTSLTTYQIGINHLFEYCAELELDPLQITPADAAHFLTWLAQRGTVQIASAKPYFSGINQFFNAPVDQDSRNSSKWYAS